MDNRAEARIGRFAVVGVLLLPLSGCGNALIYGEGTNFSLTTLRLNDDPATPVRIVSGLDRSAAAVVPRRDHDKDAVNMSADFSLDHKKTGGLFSAFTDTLTITTEFSAGDAAVTPEGTTTKDGASSSAATSTSTTTGEGPSAVATEILKR